jgi:hypothetical protein
MKPVRYSLLTPAEKRRVRLLYIEWQGNECWYCQKDLGSDPPKSVLDKPITLAMFPKGFLSNPIHLHHDHDTDLTIGAVHAYCNAVLWEHYGH